MLLATIVSTIFVSLCCAAVPAVLFIVNLRRYRAPVGGVNGARIAVLIPARDEERNIAACVESVLASTGVESEVLVLDDASSDRTAEIVNEIAVRDARVRLLLRPFRRACELFRWRVRAWTRRRR